MRTKNNAQLLLKYMYFGLPILSGILLSLTLPFADFSSLAWFALVPLLIFIGADKTTMRQAAIGGLITGFMYGIAVLYPLSTLSAWWWISPTGFLWDNRHVILSLFLILMALYSGGFFIAAFSALYKKFHKNNIINVGLFALIWALLEYAREWFVLGFTWGHLGHALHDNTYIIQFANLFGVYGISFIIVSVNISIYLLFKKNIKFIAPNLWTSDVHRLGRGWNQACSVFYTFLKLCFKDYILYFLIIFLVAIYSYGHTTVNIKQDFTKNTNVAVIHPNLTTEESAAINGYEKYISLLDKAIEQDPDIIVAPENAFPFFVIDQDTRLPLQYERPESKIKELYDRLKNKFLNNDISLIAGFHTIKGDQRFNSLAVVEGGKITGIYSKQTLLPFAEKNIEILGKNHIEPLDKGEGNQTISIQNNEITPLICSEIIFPSLSSQENSAFIVNISNDSVFDSHLVGKQNHIIAKFRAVENRKYVLRSVKGGISSIIDQFGQVLEQTDSSQEKILFKTIKYR